MPTLSLLTPHLNVVAVHEDVDEFDCQVEGVEVELKFVGDISGPVYQLASLAELRRGPPDPQDWLPLPFSDAFEDVSDVFTSCPVGGEATADNKTSEELKRK